MHPCSSRRDLPGAWEYPAGLMFSSATCLRSIGSVGHRRWQVQRMTPARTTQPLLEASSCWRRPAAAVGEIEAPAFGNGPTARVVRLRRAAFNAGASLLGSPAAAAVGLTPSEEVIVRNRLQGLGYI